jgi:hypothetical protein
MNQSEYLNENHQEAEFPTQLAYSCRIEQHPNGARITVRTYSNTIQDCIQEAIDMYRQTKGTLEAIGEKVSPIVIRETKP